MSSSSLARYDANVLLAAVAALSGAVAFVAALHLYARCLLQRRVAVAEANPRVLVLRRPPPDGHELEAGDGGGACGRGAAGMDAKALRALPVFVWEGGAAAAEHDGQCAVCLGEMEDGELGRLLPACRHAFHVECIDTWLGVSSTCPVCRTVAASPSSAGSPFAASRHRWAGRTAREKKIEVWGVSRKCHRRMWQTSDVACVAGVPHQQKW